MIEPLPPELQHFVASEATAPVSRAAQAAVRARLGATLGIAAVAAGTATASAAGTSTATAGTAAAGTSVGTAAAGGAAIKGALAIKLLAVALAVGTSAAVTTVVVTRDRNPLAHTTTSKPAKTTAAKQSARQSTIRVESIDEPIDEPIAAPTPPVELPPPPRAMKHKPPPVAAVEPPVVGPGQSTRSQSQLLADATRSLSLGDAARALELIDEDTRAHATGVLAEEREALRISALSALGRTAEAKDAARQLLVTYPHSIHRRLAERVLAEEKP